MALPQIRAYYVASVEYGRNTTPQYGLFYLGNAQAQEEFVTLCRKLSTRSSLPPPPLRALGGEIDALEAELLKAYRPPASIDRHSEFIAASATVKEARELDADGLRYGALFKYLRAVQLVAPLLSFPPLLDAEALATRLRELDMRLSEGGVDHSIGRVFLQAAQEDVAKPGAGRNAAVANAIAGNVLPRYFEALAEARPETPKPAPIITVTLVRWPYT